MITYSKRLSGKILAKWVFGLGLITAMSAQAANYYVDLDWTGPYAGTTNQPYNTIKAAVDAACTSSAPRNVYIAAGSYADVANGGAEDYSAGGGSDHGILISNVVTVSGGYAGWQGGSAFDWTAASRLPRATVIDLKGAASRAFRLQWPVAANGPSGGPLFDGITFQNGNVTNDGGVIYVSNHNYWYANATNCLFTNNVSGGNGGALRIYSVDSPAAIRGCDFVDNLASNNGGAVAFDGLASGSKTLVEDCTFLRNRAAGTNTSIEVGRGGAIGYLGGGNLFAPQSVRRCRFEANAAAQHGGALFTRDTYGVLDRCTFVSNTAPYGAAVGGATYWCGGFALTNCLVYGHTNGYAIQVEGARIGNYTLDILHSTIVSNSGGGLRARFNDGSNNKPMRVINSIVAYNGKYGIYRPEDDYAFANNNVFGNDTNYYNCTPDAGSISADPKFADPAANDYRLAKGSPCIDTAINLGITTDLDNTPRPTRFGYDIGCYEEWQIPIITNRAPVADATSVVTRAEFLYENTNIATYAYFVLDTSDKGTNSMAGWWQSASAGIQTQNFIFGTAFLGLSGDTTYWYRCMASNNYDVIFGPAGSFKTPSSGGTTRVWTGASTNALASNTNNWLGGLAPSPTDYVLLDSTFSNITWDAAASKTVARWTQTEACTGTVTFPITYPTYSTTFTNFAITGDVWLNGGRWAHTASPATNAHSYRLALTVGRDMTIGPKGQINVDSLGFPAAYGPGAGTGDNQGPSHGGQGGYKTAYLPIATYGSTFQPVTLGSGGNSGSGGAAGGGALLLTVAGLARVDGSILARGGYRPPPNNDYRPGAGGSVFITAGTLDGAGSIDVRSLGSILNAWPGGSGGRLAIVLTNGTSFGSLVFDARGQVASEPMVHGAAGTIYLQAMSQSIGQGRLIVDNGGNTLQSQAVTQPNEAINLNTLESLVVTNGGMFAVLTNTTLDFAVASIQGGGELKIRATNNVSFPAVFIITNTYRLCLDTNVAATGNWTIMTNAVMTHSQNLYAGVNPEKRITLTLNGNLTIDAGGTIDVRDRGYYRSTGPGAGLVNDVVNSSHGGQGASSGAVRPTYGSILHPTSHGSGNTMGTGSNPGAGAVALIVSGTTTVNGSIQANSIGGRPASGGSVYIRTGALLGNGTVDASSGTTDQAGAGGGRLAVILTNTNAFGPVILKAYGADGGGTTQEGAAGTIYKQTSADPDQGGIVLVHNNNLTPSKSTPLPAFTASTEDIKSTRWIAQNKGRIALVTNVAVDSLTLMTDSYLELGGYTGTVNSLTITNRIFGGGIYSASMLGPLVSDSSGGKGLIIVKSKGTLILLR